MNEEQVRHGRALWGAAGVAARDVWALCLVVVLFAAIFSAPAEAQQHRIKFDRLSIADGLSQGSGNAILQDQRGFIWIGTQDGLNRYDGHRVEVFRHDPTDADSLADNFIVDLYQDRQGRLWILFVQPGVLNRFDPRTERFQRYSHDPNDPTTLPNVPLRPRSIYEDPEGRLWFATTEGIAKLDPQTGRVQRIQHDPENENSLAHNSVFDFHEDRAGTLWVSTAGGGLHRRLPPAADGRELFAHLRHDPDDPTSLSHDSASLLFEDSTGALWVGTQGGGLNRLDAERRGFERFFTESPEVPGLAFTFPVFEDRDRQVWIATGSGILRYNLTSGAFHHDQHDPEDPHSLGSNALGALLEDSAGALWVGTAGGGLHRFDAANDRYIRYTYDPADPTSLSSNIVGYLFEDRSGILWVGTGGGGVSRFSRQKHKFEHFRQSPQNPVSGRRSRLLDLRRPRWRAVGGYPIGRTAPLRRGATAGGGAIFSGAWEPAGPGEQPHPRPLRRFPGPLLGGYWQRLGANRP